MWLASSTAHTVGEAWRGPGKSCSTALVPSIQVNTRSRELYVLLCKKICGALIIVLYRTHRRQLPVDLTVRQERVASLPFRNEHPRHESGSRLDRSSASKQCPFSSRLSLFPRLTNWESGTDECLYSLISCYRRACVYCIPGVSMRMQVDCSTYIIARLPDYGMPCHPWKTHMSHTDPEAPNGVRLEATQLPTR